MPRPTKHTHTGIYQFRQRVPVHLEAVARGRVASITIDGHTSHLKVGAALKVSLRTKDAAKAKELAHEAQAQFDLVWASLSSAPVHLTLKQCVALSGEIYRVFRSALEDEPGPAGLWAARRREAQERAKRWTAGPLDALKIARPRSLRERWGTWVDGALADHRLTVDAESYERLLAEFDRAFGDVANLLERRAVADYSPDPTEHRFPTFEAPTPALAAPSKTGDELTLTGLLDHKEKTQSQKARTYDGYRSRVRDFAKFVGHEDARRVKQEDIRNWRTSLQERGLSIKTINDGYLTAVKAALSHGAEEFGIENVAAGIRDKRDADPKGKKDYTPEQQLRILSATFNGTTKALSNPHRRAVFWAPWIMAYTGLRIGEVTQFQGRNVRWDSGVPCLLISPEDGSTKGGAAWAVGIHRHLIELGLLEMFAAVGDGPAFYTPYPHGTDLRTIKDHRRDDAAADVGNFILDALGEPAPLGRPNHAWRHTFTTLSRGQPKKGALALDKEARDFMMGSRSKVDAREGYGEWSPAVLDHEINKLPRFDVTDTGWRPTTEAVLPAATRATRKLRRNA